MRTWTGLVVTLIGGCAHGVHGFREPFLWDDEAVVVTAHRADIAEAEGALIRQLRERGEFRPDLGCEFSAQAYDVSTSETENAYQIFLVYRPELCRQAPGDASLPPMAKGADAGPMEFAVNRKDLRVIRARLRGDPVKPIGAPGPPREAAVNLPSAAPSSSSGNENQELPTKSRKDWQFAPCAEGYETHDGMCYGRLVWPQGKSCPNDFSGLLVFEHEGHCLLPAVRSKTIPVGSGGSDPSSPAVVP